LGLGHVLCALVGVRDVVLHSEGQSTRSEVVRERFSDHLQGGVDTLNEQVSVGLVVVVGALLEGVSVNALSLILFKAESTFDLGKLAGLIILLELEVVYG
jgi:hypothetical protein